MNPLSWSFPIAVTWLIMFGIIIVRAGGTFLLGRLARRGIRRFERIERIMAGAKYRRAEATIDRCGAPVVALSFLTVGLQTVINLAAGTTGMRYRRYLPALAIGGSVWALIYSTAGLMGIRALIDAYAVEPGLTVGLCACVLMAIGGLFVGLRDPRPRSEVRQELEPSREEGAQTASVMSSSSTPLVSGTFHQTKKNESTAKKA